MNLDPLTTPALETAREFAAAYGAAFWAACDVNAILAAMALLTAWIVFSACIAWSAAIVIRRIRTDFPRALDGKEAEERARKAEATRIHNQFLRDPLIRTKNEAAMATHRAASITQ